MKSKSDPAAERGEKARGKRRPIVFTAINEPDIKLAARLMVPLFLDWLYKQAVQPSSGGDRLHRLYVRPPKPEKNETDDGDGAPSPNGRVARLAKRLKAADDKHTIHGDSSDNSNE